MTTKNDITGDAIKTGHNSDAYRSNPFWNRAEIFKIERRMMEIDELRANGDLDEYTLEDMAYEYEDLAERLGSLK